MKQSSKIFVGMDVHKDSIDITLAVRDDVHEQACEAALAMCRRRSRG